MAMPHDGGCSCGKVRYRLSADPMRVHACHCRQCQRVTGSAFVLNALIEKDAVELLSGSPISVRFDGTVHTAYFCQDCGTYVWSHYGGRFRCCWFVRVGTLDNPDAFPPDVHIFTASKQPWLSIPDDASQFSESYELATIWPDRSLRRLSAVTPSDPVS